MSAVIGEPEEQPPPGPKIFIAGPRRGYPADNELAFAEAEEWLSSRGWTPVRGDAGWGLQDRSRLRALLECEGVATAPGWAEDRHAVLQVQIAWYLHLDVRPFQGW